MDKKETLELMEKLKKQAVEAELAGNWVLASQYLFDINNLLPEKLRVKMPPPPRPEEFIDKE